MIVGIDEVGRGPWAGPLVFRTVMLGKAEIEELTDSKKLTKKRREALDAQVHEKAVAVGLGWVSAEEIDDIGLGEALKTACRRALEQITVPYQQIIIDGTINFLKDTGKGPYVTTLAKADLLIPSVSAASIVAKVARDRFMADQDKLYPGYDFGSHVGYGTAAHRAAIDKLGVTPLHRLSFAPLAKYATTKPSPINPQALSVSSRASRSSGNRGEDSAAQYLAQKGYRILERNWRVKAAEIDIIAEKDGVIHFVEVKYRKSSIQGGGIAAITPTKLKHMERAARLWMQRFGDHDAKLSVIEVSGSGYEVTRFVEQV